MPSMTELICPNCHVALDERQLNARTWTVETCPHCQAVVRRDEGFRWQDRDALLQDDVESIEAWLRDVSRACADRGALFRVEQREGKKSGRKYRWDVATRTEGGGQSPWSCTVEYDADTPHIFEVRLTSTEDEPAFLDVPNPLLDACAEQGVQAHACESRRWVEWEGERREFRWGARQLLATAPLGVALFHAVLRRLDHAMRDALARAQNQRSGPLR